MDIWIYGYMDIWVYGYKWLNKREWGGEGCREDVEDEEKDVAGKEMVRIW